MPTPIDFDVLGIPHRALPMPPVTKMLLLKRLAPAVGIIMPVLLDAQAELTGTANPPQTADSPDAVPAPVNPLSIDTLSKMLAGFMDGLAALSDADATWVINTCVASVERQQGPQVWVKIANKAGGLMFQDIDVTELMTITAYVLKGNLGDFLSGARSLFLGALLGSKST